MACARRPKRPRFSKCESIITSSIKPKPVAIFTSLKKGNYYIYGKGWDKEIEKDVVGGIPYTIKDDNKVLNINVPVTEDH